MLATGTRYRFVPAEGDVREYVLESAEDPSVQKGALAVLRNLATEKRAHITVYWLLGRRESMLGRWERVDA